MNQTAKKIKKSSKQFTTLKKCIQKEEILDEAQLFKYVSELHGIYQVLSTYFTLDEGECKSTSKKNKTNQLSELLSYYWYCQELHIIVLQYPLDQSKQLAYVDQKASEYSDYLIQHYGQYIELHKREFAKEDLSQCDFKQVIDRPFFAIDDHPFFLQAKFTAILMIKNNLTNYEKKVISHKEDRLTWNKAKSDLSILIIALSKCNAFLDATGKPVATKNLILYFERMIDIDLKADIYQSFNNFKKRKCVKDHLLRDLLDTIIKEISK